MPRFNFFGEDIHAKVNAEITVLEEDLTEDDIYDRSNDESEDDESKDWTFNERESALNARRWLDGEEDISPSSGWRGVANSKFAKGKK